MIKIGKTRTSKSWKVFITKVAAKRKLQVKKVRHISHPQFYNVDYRQAEEMMSEKPVGFYIIRPSTKGPRHLSITWKVADKICQHVDVTDLGNGGKLGYAIETTKFSELDELLIHFIEPMTRNVRLITELPQKFQKKDLESMLRYVTQQSNLQRKSAYGFILVPDKPGRFYFCFHHFGGSRPKYEYVIVRPDGFNFREKTYVRLEKMIDEFKHVEQKKMKEKSKAAHLAKNATRPTIPGQRPSSSKPTSKTSVRK